MKKINRQLNKLLRQQQKRLVKLHKSESFLKYVLIKSCQKDIKALEEAIERAKEFAKNPCDSHSIYPDIKEVN